ncbi:MAG TPA: TonB-dependent receptor, partial [Bacteroidales bacterium]|nr:TonB-dependent receptor [Bacteroidales bacterium]
MHWQRVLILLLPFLFAGLQNNIAIAQGQLKGNVRDAFNNKPLQRANVVLQELQLVSYTQDDGSFSFKMVPSGSYTLRISHVGYEQKSVTAEVNESPDEISVMLRPVIIQIDPITITATLNRRKISNLPGRGAVLDKKQADMLPAQNLDDLLLGIANIYVNRPWGIFSKGASVSMRGLPGSARTLIMIDGAPLNKVAGGTVNWNFLEPSDIEKIEVIKGPASAIYGNNAMGGVISMETIKPQKALDGHVKAFGGSMGTYGGSFMLGGKKNKDHGFYWNTKAFMRRGDGYIIQPEETRDTTDVKTSLEEYSMGLQAGYQLDTSDKIAMEYRYYNGTFGTGTRVFEEDGSWDRYRSHHVQAKYETTLGNYMLNARVYYQLENFDRQIESINRTGKYKLSDSESVKHDRGLWLNISKKLFNMHLVTAGLDVKIGDLEGQEIYRTSTDELVYGGELSFAGIFIQDEFSLFRKLSVIAGMRFDMANFYNGSQSVINPTSNTGFLSSSSMSFSNSSWVQWSPKLALKYGFNDHLGAYVSFSSGFMPPKIDDLVRSGKISKGFKLANPELTPEVIFNYEAG